MDQLFGGVETGGTWTVCALGDGRGRLAAREQFRTGPPEHTISEIAAFFNAHDRPAAVGVGAFGPLDLRPGSPTWGEVTTTPKADWRRFPLATRIRDELGLPVAFDTDVNAAAVGEHRWGAGRDCGSLCYLTVGTGIGAGILVDGRPLHGLVHPEAGHMLIGHDPVRDPFAGVCPVHGDCWEGLAGGEAIAARWGADASELPDDHPGWALEVDYLALGILAIVMIISPQRVIAGGGVMERPGLRGATGTRLLELAGGYLETPLLGERIGEYLVAPELGDDAGVLGAIALAGAIAH
ncbi:MAG: ROK family protein [Solirubrobacteraceae bacterium]